MNSLIPKIKKFDRIILGGLLSLVVIPLLYLLLIRLELPIRYIPISDMHKVLFLNGELLILYLLFRKYFFPGWDKSKIEYLFRDLLIANCCLILPFFLFYSDRKQSVNETLRFIRPYLILSYAALVLFTTIYTLSTFKQVKRIRLWLSTKIENQKENDIRVSNERLNIFSIRIPQLSKKPFLGRIALSAIKEGYIVLIGLFALAGVGLLLRLNHLNDLPPYTDETLHLITAKSIFTGETNLQDASYTRSLYTVTLPVVLSFYLFDISLWSARISGILVNILALIPLYLLTRKLNKPIAILSVGLFSFSPWIIATSQTVREYAYFPFFIYLTALLMVEFYEYFPEGFILLEDFRKILTLKNILFIGFLGLNLFYIYFDPNSSYKVTLVMYPAFGLLLLRKFNWRNIPNLTIVLFLIIFLGFVIGTLVVKTGEDFHFVRKKLNVFFLFLFYEKPVQQWYYGRPLISFVLILLALSVVRLWDRKKIVLPLSFLVYGGTLLAFLLFRLKTNRPRYATVIEYWHLILIAVGLFLAYAIIKSIIKTKHQWAIWLLLLLFFWNIPHSYKPFQDFRSGIHPITTEYHANLLPAYKYLSAEYKPGEVLVTTGFVERVFRFINGQDLNNYIRYSYVKSGAKEAIYDAIDTHPHGWIVLDGAGGYILSRPVPLEDFIYAGKEVQYLGWFGDAYILKWGD